MFKLKFLSSAIVAVALVAFVPAQVSAASKVGVQVRLIQQQLTWTKNDVESVKLITNNDSSYSVNVTLTPAAGKKLETLTASNIGKSLQLGVGKSIISQTTIQSRLGKSFQIMTESLEQAQRIINALSK